MAYRIHIAGAFGASQQALQGAMSNLQSDPTPIDFQQDDQWLWSSFSVWHVKSSHIADCLQTLDEPSVLLTSEDGMRWYLSIFQGGKQHVRLCHEFGLLGTGNDEWEEETDEDEQCAAGICQFDDDFEQLAFLWDEDEAARVAAEEQAEIADYVAGKEIVSEQEEFGCTLPSDLVQQLTNETDGKRACQIFLSWQHQTIHDLLTELSVTFDREALAGCFDPQLFTELEADSDLGNMPRLVRALGMSSAFSNESEASSQAGPDQADDSDSDLSDGEDWDEDLTGESSETGSDLMEQINDAAQAMIDSLGGIGSNQLASSDCVQGELLASTGSFEAYATDSKQLVETHGESDKIKQAAAELEAVGFHHVGDLICPSLSGVVCMCFAGPSEMHAHILVEMYCCREFWTQFENGHVLTTNNEENMGESEPELGHYFLSYDELSMPDLLKKHRVGIDKFRLHKQTEPIVHETTMNCFGQHFTNFLARSVC